MEDIGKRTCINLGVPGREERWLLMIISRSCYKSMRQSRVEGKIGCAKTYRITVRSSNRDGY